MNINDGNSNNFNTEEARDLIENYKYFKSDFTISSFCYSYQKPIQKLANAVFNGDQWTELKQGLTRSEKRALSHILIDYSSDIERNLIAGVSKKEKKRCYSAARKVRKSYFDTYPKIIRKIVALVSDLFGYGRKMNSHSLDGFDPKTQSPAKEKKAKKIGVTTEAIQSENEKDPPWKRVGITKTKDEFDMKKAVARVQNNRKPSQKRLEKLNAVFAERVCIQALKPLLEKNGLSLSRTQLKALEECFTLLLDELVGDKKKTGIPLEDITADLLMEKLLNLLETRNMHKEELSKKDAVIDQQLTHYVPNMSKAKLSQLIREFQGLERDEDELEFQWEEFVREDGTFEKVKKSLTLFSKHPNFVRFIQEEVRGQQKAEQPPEEE